MALVKVLALDATGVIETEIDTSSGGGGSGGSIITHTIDLTNGQTAVTVPGGYTSAGIAVYLNGAYLSPAEYTATTSPNITLVVGAPSDDSVLDVLVFETSGGSGGASALDDLTDVIITSVALNEVLKWNGTNWVNSVAPGGGGGAPLTDPQFTAHVGIGTPASPKYNLTTAKDLNYAGSNLSTGFTASEAGIKLALNIPTQTPATSEFVTAIVTDQTVQRQSGTNASTVVGNICNISTTVNGLRDVANKDYLYGSYTTVKLLGTDTTYKYVGGCIGLFASVSTSGGTGQTISNMTCLQGFAVVTSGNTCGPVNGALVGAQVQTGATSTGSVIGLNISMVLTGTYPAAYSIYSSNALAHFYHAGKIAVGGAARVPTEQMDVTGHITHTTPTGGDNSNKSATTAYVQTELAAAGLISDGITAATITDMAMDTLNVINTLAPYFYRKNIGAAQLFTSAVPYGGSSLQYGDGSASSSNVGTDALASLRQESWSLVSGTTSTGYALGNRQLATAAAAVAYNPYNMINSGNAVVGRKLSASAVVYVDALSDGTDTYSATVTLLGTGPLSNNAPAATDTGFVLSYTHTINSGNWVITYRGADNSLKTLNTAVAPIVGLATAMRIIAKANRTAANTATVTIDIGGTVYTITDSAFNVGDTYHSATVAGRIVKTAGTTSRQLNLRHCSGAMNIV